MCTLCTPSSALFVPSVTSDKDPPLLLSRYLPARIIGAPIAHVTPVGSGIHIMIKPTFCMCFPQIGYKLYDPNIYGDAMVKNTGERLESIKAAHKSSHGASSIRMEDYLEVIAELVDLKGYATTLDISRYMDVSAPSVTKMLHRLDDEKYLKYERYHGINLTKKRQYLMLFSDTTRQLVSQLSPLVVHKFMSPHNIWLASSAGQDQMLCI